ncbi:MAG TPA: hypothetical protein VNA68_02480 [Candidatus Dormibacteraeota bacterium]|nr:hypothetical protein [Candidatus Dormibacteraeota bacterium]
MSKAAELQLVVSSARHLLCSEIQHLRQDCRHKRIIEVDYKPQTHLPSLAPRRMCLDCGIEEQGWGAGYKILTKEPLETLKDRDEFYSRRPFPDHADTWAWCYGGRGHAVPKENINGHYRCKLHERQESLAA